MQGRSDVRTLLVTSGSGASAKAIEAISASGTALEVTGKVSLLSQTVGTGAATATFPGNNKPGAATTNTWLTISVNGSTYYIPVWT